MKKIYLIYRGLYEVLKNNVKTRDNFYDLKKTAIIIYSPIMNLYSTHIHLNLIEGISCKILKLRDCVPVCLIDKKLIKEIKN